VQFAEKGDAPSLQQAIQVLYTAPGPPQPEVLRDLRATEPDLADADQRLQALYQALQQRVDTPDPALAQRQLHDVLAMPRYAGLSTGPSLAQRIVSAILDALQRFLNWLRAHNLNPNVPVWVWFGLAGLLVLLIIFWPIRGAITAGGRQARLRSGPVLPPPSVDFFAEADRLASGGDYIGAIRALAGGVAVRLSGERAWDRSPYTVRELFARADQLETLRPLLRSFEEASYGQRRPDQASYARAAEAAARYRREAA
jgi:hypothetical protein